MILAEGNDVILERPGLRPQARREFKDHGLRFERCDDHIPNGKEHKAQSQNQDDNPEQRSQISLRFCLHLCRLLSHQPELDQTDDEYEDGQQVADRRAVAKVNAPKGGFIHQGQDRVGQVHWVTAIGH